MQVEPPQRIKLEYYPFVTVAVCTRDRSTSLVRAIQSLVRLNYPNFEVLIIDNHPSDNRTALAVRELSYQYSCLRYILEPRPGLNWARNRAIREARGEIIAYTDDDVVADDYWLLSLVQIFQSHNAACVAGGVLPYEMETNAQFLFELYGGFCRSFNRVVYHKNSKLGHHYPLSAHHFGTGANMAFRVETLKRLGGFDNALDAGTATNGAGDLEMFFRIVKEGYTLVYEPSALVWHVHRRTYPALRRQLYNNGMSYYAYLTRTFIHYPDERGKVLTFAVWWWFYWNVFRLARNVVKTNRFPLDLIWAETLAVFKGPFAYFKAREQARRIADGEFDLKLEIWLDSEISLKK
jgi:O-antigen biosynthesis protein